MCGWGGSISGVKEKGRKRGWGLIPIALRRFHTLRSLLICFGIRRYGQFQRRANEETCRRVGIVCILFKKKEEAFNGSVVSGDGLESR